MKFLVGCTLVLVSGWIGIVALLAVVTEHPRTVPEDLNDPASGKSEDNFIHPVTKS
jgi:hypothetical protein